MGELKQAAIKAELERDAREAARSEHAGAGHCKECRDGDPCGTARDMAKSMEVVAHDHASRITATLDADKTPSNDTTPLTMAKTVSVIEVRTKYTRDGGLNWGWRTEWWSPEGEIIGSREGPGFPGT